MKKGLLWLMTVVLVAAASIGLTLMLREPEIEYVEVEKIVEKEVIVEVDPVKTDTVDEETESDEEGFVRVDQEDYDYLLELYNKYNQVEQLEQYIRGNYYQSVEDVDFNSYIIKGLFQALEDPYSEYYTAEEFKAYTESASGSYEGIGVVVAPGEDGFITVVSPIKNSPGFDAGLMTNDKILKVDGVEYFADELTEAVLNIRGPKGTTVVLTVKRGDEIIDIPVVRDEIELEAVSSEVLDNGIGYLQMAQFDEDVATEFENHLNDLLDQDIQGLIIDLRNNGGGYLSQCLAITDRLIGEGIIVKTKDNQDNVEVEYSDADELDIPFVILVNEGSASASEILTGAVKDNEEGTIIGTTTFGKGLVQNMIPLTSFDNAGFKLTIKQYFTPDDHYIHGVGIEPNIVIENDPETEEDEQMDKAIEVILDAIQ